MNELRSIDEGKARLAGLKVGIFRAIIALIHDFKI